MMIAIQFLVVLLFIFIGARLGGIGIGFAGGAGVIVLALLGVTPGDMPLDVISIILAVIVAISAMQVAGGMEYLVQVADRILRRNPKHLTFLAPIITYLMTIMAGTGHTAFSMMPVITEVAKENNIRPVRPLTIGVVASQIAITASPISAAVVFFSSELEGRGIDYIQLLAVVIPSTFIACMATAAIMMMIDKVRGVGDLSEDAEYKRRLEEGLVLPPQRYVRSELLPGAKRSVGIFLVGLVAVMAYATAISPKLGLVTEPVMGRDAAIISIMLSVGTAIVAFCKIKTDDILSSSVFRSGMSAAICVLGVAWLGTTFVTEHQDRITTWAGDLLNSYSWLLAVVLFFAAALLYSQAATTRALMPLALSIGISPVAAVASFAAVSALFVLPTYPTLLAAVQLDDTGTTRIGKYVFNHPFLVPGALAISIAVALGYVFGAIIL
jgi:anaerobic C4-dicarboxylate transporter DcuA